MVSATELLFHFAETTLVLKVWVHGSQLSKERLVAVTNLLERWIEGYLLRYRPSRIGVSFYCSFDICEIVVVGGGRSSSWKLHELSLPASFAVVRFLLTNQFLS